RQCPFRPLPPDPPPQLLAWHPSPHGKPLVVARQLVPNSVHGVRPARGRNNGVTQFDRPPFHTRVRQSSPHISRQHTCRESDACNLSGTIEREGRGDDLAAVGTSEGCEARDSVWIGPAVARCNIHHFPA